MKKLFVSVFLTAIFVPGIIFANEGGTALTPFNPTQEDRIEYRLNREKFIKDHNLNEEQTKKMDDLNSGGGEISAPMPQPQSTTTTTREAPRPPICISTAWKQFPCENGQAIAKEIPQFPEGCRLKDEPLLKIVQCDSPIRSEDIKTVSSDNSKITTDNTKAIPTILPPQKTDQKLSTKLSGTIVLQIESHGEAHYVNPDNNKRYYLGRPADAFQIMRELGLGASHDFIEKNLKGTFPDHVIGKILIDVGDSGKAYYIYPKDKKAYYLGRPADAFRVMRELGLGISNDDLAKIEAH